MLRSRLFGILLALFVSVAPAAVAAAPVSATPATVVSGRTVGQTISYNTGAPGQCTWGAMEKFRAYSGRYAALAGNAADWYHNARATGWSTSATPRPFAMVVFPPGVQGASRYGHVGWVDALRRIGGSTWLHMYDMNGPGGPFATRWTWIRHVPGMGYILAPRAAGA
ncbi:hypothetical protein ASG12_04985 [Williamsia sp. Leaf354]|uniref:CHAP domain-containing protein n=1 Tax=Williamsia sp. Leaf354 TaxID=1736349 RepID=UPI0007022402|nr:CHAP domain-containing protein [Williamsia sp. Leaf354]KQS00286.1 hypothetical protein ASG12_04985 [Williamsia sp. Leaf354]